MLSGVKKYCRLRNGCSMCFQLSITQSLQSRFSLVLFFLGCDVSQRSLPYPPSCFMSADPPWPLRFVECWSWWCAPLAATPLEVGHVFERQCWPLQHLSLGVLIFLKGPTALILLVPVGPRWVPVHISPVQREHPLRQRWYTGTCLQQLYRLVIWFIRL